MIYEQWLILTQNLKSTFINVNVKRKFYLTLMLKNKNKKQAMFVNNITKKFKIYTCAFEIWTKPR